MNKTLVNFRLDENTIRFLKSESKAQGMSMTEFVRKCIQYYREAGIKVGFIPKEE